jgi:glucosylceramidase
MNKIFYLILFLAGLVSCQEKSPDLVEEEEVDGKVTLWVTTGNQAKLLTQDASLRLMNKQQSNQGITITLDQDETMQEMEGFGAALTESSAYVLSTKLKPDQRTELLRELFGREAGIGISYLRIAMGTSDFSLEDFTYNDLKEGETDIELEHFSVEKDKKYLIPVLKEILTISPDIKIMASPWSAPAWMKTNAKLAGGKLKPEYYKTYANYFLKYLKAYEKEGIPIDAISIQNEPLHEAAYPSMRMEATEQIDFINNHLGPLFAKENIKTGILIYDHNWDRIDYPLKMLTDAFLRSFVKGTAFHGYAGSVTMMSSVHNYAPDLGIYFTEISGGEWATDFADNMGWNMKNIFIGAPRNWSKNALLWNLALDENHGPKNGGCQDCRGVITISDGGFVRRNVEYYAIAHLSKFVMPGAKRIKSSFTDAVEQVAFKNPDGSIVLVVSNDASNLQRINIVFGEKQLTYNQEPRSTVTYVFSE